jgi:hypothetical protein
MDILVIVLLFALYVIPEILRRRRKPTAYKYPEFPEPTTESTNQTTDNEPRRPKPLYQPAVIAAVAPIPVELPKAPVLATVQSVATDEPVVFHGLAYGLVMAEVLGPPRSLSGFRQHR